MDGLHINMVPASMKFTSRMREVWHEVEVEGNKAVEAQTRNVRQMVIATTPVDTGRLKASWSPATNRGRLTWGFGTHLDYANKLEYGGYTGVGQRTMRLGGGDLGAGFIAEAGIYSRQAPLGFVRKALAKNAPQFLLRVENVVRRAWKISPLTEGTVNWDQAQVRG